jgi:peptide deformylase
MHQHDTKIIQIGNSVLRQKASKLSLDEIRSPKVQDIIEEMKVTMRNAPGVGLAAPQIGVSLQIIVIEDCEERMVGIDPEILKERERIPIKFHVIINPKLKVIDESVNLFFEGCLSVKNYSRITPRAKKVEVECYDENGNKKTIIANGWYARILQHEIDHLNSKLYVDVADIRTEIINNEENFKKWRNASSAMVRQYYDESLSKKNFSNAKIDAIIFDLGKVIVDVNHEKTYLAFEAICQADRDEIKKIFKQEDYLNFELGRFSYQEFFLKIKNYLKSEHDITAFVDAWNAMIVGVPTDSVSLLKQLRKKYQIFALSNTNYCHVDVINRHLQNDYSISNIKELFDKIYYSHELGLGKPDKEIFKFVLNDLQLNPENILFIDDNFENIQISRELGFKTIHLLEQNKLAEELYKAGIINEN